MITNPNMLRTVIIFILLGSFLSGFSQDELLDKKISISFNSVQMRHALTQIEDSSGTSFSYNGKLKNFNVLVSGTYNSKTVKHILNHILPSCGLSYKVIGKQVSVFLKQENQLTSSAKQNTTVQGSIRNSLTKSPLQYVSIIIDGTLTGTVSNMDGQFSLTGLPSSEFTLVFSYMGYLKKKIKNLSVRNGTLDLGPIYLEQKALSLSEVTVTPGIFSVMGAQSVSEQTIAAKDIKYMSFSEDISRAVSRLPGVSSNDYSSRFSVRGGEADEVLITLDGMELYEPFHQRDFVGGLVSIVDIEAVGGLELQTGGFSTEYGNKQSAVFNISTRENTENKRHTILGLSVINAGIYTDGTFASNKLSYLVSARRGMLDQSFKVIGSTENIPTYYDVLGKIKYKFNSKWALSLHVLHAGDETKVRDITDEAFDIHDTEYKNTYLWLTVNSIYNPRLSSTSIVYGANISQNRNGNTQKYEYSDKLSFTLTDHRNYLYMGLKQDWIWLMNDRVVFKGGFDLRKSSSEYDYKLDLSDVRVNEVGEVGPYTLKRAYSLKPVGDQVGLYTSGKLLVFPDFFIETGIRYDQHTHTGDRLWSPRISLAYSLSKNTFLKAAYGYYYQSQTINDLEVNFGIKSFNSTQLSNHYILGVEHNLKLGIVTRLEIYYKDIRLPGQSYQNIRDAFEVFPEVRSDLATIYLGGARAHGVELMIKYDKGRKFSCWFSYAYAKAEERVDSIHFDGLLTHRTGWLPRGNNQNHTLYTDVLYRPKKSWVINLSWQFWKGWPLTTYEYEYTTLDNGDLHFYPRHLVFRGEDYPAYHRLDLRVNK